MFDFPGIMFSFRATKALSVYFLNLEFECPSGIPPYFKSKERQLSSAVIGWM